eukprot:g12824.t1
MPKNYSWNTSVSERHALEWNSAPAAVAGQVVNQQQLKLKCSNSFAALETPRNDELREDHEKFFVSLPTNVNVEPSVSLSSGPV